MNEPTYLVVGSKPWNRHVFQTVLRTKPGRWRFISERDELTHARLLADAPHYVFFLHWSWKVPADIVRDFECICFHMTDVPYGRGGSPLQNLIVRGHHETKLTALRMTAELDAGPVYLKRPLSLEGSAEEILMRANTISAAMIEEILQTSSKPTPQSGPVTVFKRRTPAESEVPSLPSVEAMHDFIRMLDAEGYPRAFIELNGFHYEFSRASLRDGRIAADVTITPIQKTQQEEAK
ncbi:MAG: methionyl-tRNA formyltransferase [Verrucomicrobia bacterium]|nr:methionyl-tRNA formyltransferase [Verrucomicrobiota bacterium]